VTRSRLDSLLQTPIAWNPTPSAFVPYVARVEGRELALRLGEFPEEPMFALFVDGQEMGAFDDWPSGWSRPRTPGSSPLFAWAQAIAARARGASPRAHDDSTNAGVTGSLDLAVVLADTQGPAGPVLPSGPFTPGPLALQRAGLVTALLEEPERRTRVVLGEFSFFATPPRGASLPFRVGQELTVRQDAYVEGIHLVRDVAVTLADGALLAASIGSGSAEWAVGWEIEVGSEPAAPWDGSSMATCTSPPLWFRRRGRAAAVRGNQWRRLEVAGERWLLCGHAMAWGPGPLPPDAKSYRRFDILRERSDA
jgi:hypothetical protein